MFHYRELRQHSNRVHERIEAGKIIQDAVDENMRDFLKDLKESSIPLEKHEEIIRRVRSKLQAEAFKLFEKELEEANDTKDRSSSPSK